MEPPGDRDMFAVLKLAGFCAAEALLNLSEACAMDLDPAEPRLLPSLAIEDAARKRLITVFDSVTPQTFADVALLLDRFTPSDKYAVLTSDGFVTIDGRKIDSISVAAHLLVLPRQSIEIVIPYYPPHDTQPFKFGRSRVGSFSGFDIGPVDISSPYNHGRDSHSRAEEIWKSHFRP